MNVLFYGNCQVKDVLNILNLGNTYNIFHIECYIESKINKQDFTDIIKKCDIIITQPIKDNYKDVDYLSTSYIIKHKKSNCKLILFDSCYFYFYYFDLTYKIFNNDILHKPIDYHYNEMIECYNNNKSIEYYINNFVNNLDLKTSKELEIIAQNSLEQLQNRHKNTEEKYKYENIFIIGIHEYIKNNYKDKLLFYSMNHPTKYVIQFICEKIINILQIENTLDYTIDTLENAKCILYKCIQKIVNFDINNHNALTIGLTDVSKITQLYYDTYKKIGMTKYEKILIFQYGKVGSCSILKSDSSGKYYEEIQKTYDEKIIHTHGHLVAKDVLSKYKNILVINIVRLPIDRNISAFHQNQKRHHPEIDYNQLSINEIIQKYDQLYSVKNLDNWMFNFFKIFNIDIDNFKFDKINKYNKLRFNGNDILLFRYEDLEYIISDILPKYNMFVKKKENVSSEKIYAKEYKTFKETYKINDFEKEKIINSKITNIYYSKKEILEHIKKYL